jgi:hypothetical protein
MHDTLVITEAGRLLKEAKEMRVRGELKGASQRLQQAAVLLESHRLPLLSAIVSLIDEEEVQETAPTAFR